MRRKIFILSIFLATTLGQASQPAAAANNELGENMIVFEPKARPAFTSASERYWQCDGMVQPSLQKIVFDELAMLSKRFQIRGPSEYCTFSIAGPGSIYSIEFFVSSQDLERVRRGKDLEETRKMTFKVLDDVIYREYTIYSWAKNNLFEQVCFEMSGKEMKSCWPGYGDNK